MAEFKAGTNSGAKSDKLFGDDDGGSSHCNSAWCKIVGSLVLAMIGVIFCCAAFPTLYWNEGRAVLRAQVLNEAKECAIKVDPQAKPAPETEGKLIHFVERPHCTASKHFDPEFLVESEEDVGVKTIERRVQMYQWEEQSHEEGDKDNRRTVYDAPVKVWGSVPPRQVSRVPDYMQADLSRGAFRNPSAEIMNDTFMQGYVQIGQYRPSAGMVNTIMQENAISVKITDKIATQAREAFREDGEGGPHVSRLQALKTALHEQGSTEDKSDEPSDAPPMPPMPGHLSETFKKEFGKKGFHAVNDTIIIGNSSSSPEVGDYKVSWQQHALQYENGQAVKYTVLAAPHLKEDHTLLRAWAENSYEFHVDSCCSVVCPIGYKLVDGGGCVAQINEKLQELQHESTDNDVEQELTEGAEEDTPLMHTQTTTSPEERALRTNPHAHLTMVEYAVPGDLSVQHVVHIGNQKSSQRTWFFRLFGSGLMWLGFIWVMSPITTFLSFIPLIGHGVAGAVGLAVAIVAFLLCSVLSVFTIAVAWWRYRPVLSILIMVVIVAIVAPILVLAH